MPLSRFMLFVGAFHLVFGAFFLLFAQLAIELFIVNPAPSSAVIVRGLSGICFAFGLMNLMARNDKHSPALKAVLTGTLFYLLFTVSCDIHWVLIGILAPLAWLSVALRLAFAIGYIHYLVRKR